MSKFTSLRERNRERLRRQILDSARRLVQSHGFHALNAERIAAAAEIGRATFFRYFDSTEDAVVVGFHEERLTAMVDALSEAPKALGPVDALIWSFARLDEGFPAEQRALLRQQARLLHSSPSLRAKSLEFHARYEQVIAEAIAPHFRHGASQDGFRPRLLAAAALAVTQACLDQWAARDDDSDLNALVFDALDALKAGFGEQPVRSRPRTLRKPGGK